MPWAKRIGASRDKIPQLYPTASAKRLRGKVERRQSSQSADDIDSDDLINCAQCGAVVDEVAEQVCWLCSSDNASGDVEL